MLSFINDVHDTKHDYSQKNAYGNNAIKYC